MCEILLQINMLKKGINRPKSITDIYPFLEFHGHQDMIDKLQRSPDVIFGVKTHLHASYFTRMLEGDPRRCPKILVVVRNPKDTLVSYFNHHQSRAVLKFENRTFSDFFELFKMRKLLFGSMIDHVASWWSYRHHSRVKFITYEDMLERPKASIEKVASFLGYFLSDDEVEIIQNNSSITSMRHRGQTAYFGDGVLLREEVSPFFRKGIKGTGRLIFQLNKVTIWMSL